jgi:hypothetical protein
VRALSLILGLASAPLLFAAGADVRVSTFTAREALVQAERFTVRMRWRNDGPDAAAIVFATLDVPGSYVLSGTGTSNWPCEPSLGNSVFECKGSALAPGAEAEMVVTMRAPASGSQVSLTARVHAATEDPDRSNDNATLTVPLSQSTRENALSVSPQAQDLHVSRGERTAIPLLVSNAGPDEARDVAVSLAFAPGALIPIEVTGDGWKCPHPTHSPQIVQCQRESLSSHATSTLHLAFTAPSVEGIYPFAAKVTANEHHDSLLTDDVARATVIVGSETSTESYVRFMVPLTGSAVPGANGALWHTDTTALVASSAPIPVHPDPGALPLGRPFDAREAGLVGSESWAGGEFVYVRERDRAKLRMTSRVFDAARQIETAGSEIPIVTDSEFSSRPASILGIPVSPVNRLTLRIYDRDGRSGARVAIRLYVNDEETPRGALETTLTLPPIAGTTAGSLPTHPASVMIDPARHISLDATARTLRIDIEPLDNVPVWSFVSVTNNATHHVTTFSAQ